MVLYHLSLFLPDSLELLELITLSCNLKFHTAIAILGKKPGRL